MKIIGKGSGVVGIYPTHESLESGAQALRVARFRNSDISVLYLAEMGFQDPVRNDANRFPDGAVTGVSAGMLVGGVLGWLAEAGKLTIPGLELFVAAGPIVAFLGASAGSALGGIVGGLVGMGVPAREAERFQKRLLEGGTLLSIRTDNPYWTTRAREILERTGAEEIALIGNGGGSRSKEHSPPTDPERHWMQ